MLRPLRATRALQCSADPAMAKTAQDAVASIFGAADPFRVIHSPRSQHFEQKAELIGSQTDANAADFVINL
jgi:hypothetical protein